eukprot:7820718-Pyramimonas_sp.AAC.1
MGQTWKVEKSASSPKSRLGNKSRSISSCPSPDWSPPRVYPLVAPPIGPRPGYILLSVLRLVPAPGISSCPSSDWSPPG